MSFRNVIIGGLLASAAHAQAGPEVVARFNGPMPTGVTVSASGRVFVCFPRWGDPVTHTVAEVKNGREIPFPSKAYATFDPKNPKGTLVSVQSVVVDPTGRLWMLDTGSKLFAPPIPGGAKLVGVDLATNKVVKTIVFPPDVVLPTTYLNDVRFDVEKKLAYITDSAQKGPNGIIVVNLESGESWRKLDGHPSVEEEPSFVPSVEGKPLYNKGKPISMGSDGIALSPDGAKLYYTQLAGHRLYSVPTSALADRNVDAAAVVKDEGEKGGASDGLEMDSSGRVYATNYEQASLVRREGNGRWTTLTRFDRTLWPDTLSITDNWLYCMTNGLHRQKDYQGGKDLRKRPYLLYRTRLPGIHPAGSAPR